MGRQLMVTGNCQRSETIAASGPGQDRPRDVTSRG